MFGVRRSGRTIEHMNIERVNIEPNGELEHEPRTENPEA